MWRNICNSLSISVSSRPVTDQWELLIDVTMVNVIWIHFPWKALVVYGCLPSELRHWRRLRLLYSLVVFLLCTQQQVLPAQARNSETIPMLHFSLLNLQETMPASVPTLMQSILRWKKSFQEANESLKECTNRFCHFCCAIMLMLRGTIF